MKAVIVARAACWHAYMYTEHTMRGATYPPQPVVVVHGSQQRFGGEGDRPYRRALRVDDDVQAVPAAEHQLPLQLRPVCSVACILYLLQTDRQIDVEVIHEHVHE